jgi:hypothetical protein
MSVEVWDFVGKPSVNLSGIGALELKSRPNGVMRTDFYVSLPGTYTLTIKDSNSSASHELEIAQHTYLDFGKEFGTFFVLFLIVMGGIILWTMKIMQKKMP